MRRSRIGFNPEPLAAHRWAFALGRREHLSQNSVKLGMRKSLPFLLIGAVLMVGCTAERHSDRDIVRPAAIEKGSSEGLEFLADIPSLKDVSLKMSGADLLDILHRQKLDYTRGIAAGQTTYYVHPKDGVTVIFMFRDGHCSGIQRLGAAGGS